MLDVQYEAQPNNSRKCGAYCARMILKSRGTKNVSAEQVWLKSRTNDNRGGKFIKTQALVKILIKNNLHAMAVSSSKPLEILDACIEKNVDVILGCRQFKDVDLGHFMVLIDTDADHITVHDPHPIGGPNRKIPRFELAQLFQPLGSESELPEGLLILIKRAEKNEIINGTINDSFNCPQPNCEQRIVNPFSHVIEAFGTSEALANRLLCIKCDKLFYPIRI